ncbi:MAG: serine hydrolase [Verrucomicrobia bacterium]|nr:MAG: serine hydrolase [Verrucomicrobiota bacterium]
MRCYARVVALIERLFRRDAETNTRDACATASDPRPNDGCLMSTAEYKCDVVFRISSASQLLVGLLIATSTSAFAEIRADDCARAAKYSESRRGVSMLMMQNGRVIFEHYANGGSARGRWPIFSGTKSFWGIATLAAIRDGLLKFDDPVSDTITEWKSDPRKAQITIRQLLNQTDGIEGASRLQRASIRNRNAMAIRLPTVAEPGSAFVYGPSHLQIFSELLRRKLKGRDTISYFEGRVSNRLGLGRLNFKKDSLGNPLPATGFELTAREWARLGELVLGHGNYHGRQIIPAALLREAFAGSPANPSYGLTFWLNQQAPNGREADMERMLDLPWQNAQWTDVCICKDAPPDMVVALGSGYQRLFIIPSMKAIIVRQGSNAKFSDAHFLRLVLGNGG